ncbi:hypothetical protein EMO89_00160 [Bifidobacterium tissieri]|uniref:Uncharacterized protein n=1 Tax=Bifidobacterium tissieri TaxID=1630162 RepID=A0A5M9ZWE6_9BIFI|nr:hypothetical protein [Bifidobacterium tissieri]KAA8831977.1 hypothetical protein EMO89_00160 [Bifidobacterium tissieri]
MANGEARPPRRALDWEHVAQELWLPDIWQYWVTEDTAPGSSAPERLKQNAETQLYANVNEWVGGHAYDLLRKVLKAIYKTRADALHYQGEPAHVSWWACLMVDVLGTVNRLADLPPVDLNQSDALALRGIRQSLNEAYEKKLRRGHGMGNVSSLLDRYVYAVTDTHPNLRFILTEPLLKTNPAITDEKLLEWCTIDNIRRISYYVRAEWDDVGYYRYTPEEWRDPDYDGELIRPITYPMFDAIANAVAAGRRPEVPLLDLLAREGILVPKQLDNITKYGQDAFDAYGYPLGDNEAVDHYRSDPLEQRREQAKRQHEYREAGKGKKPPRRRAPGALPKDDHKGRKPRRPPRRGKPTA